MSRPKIYDEEPCCYELWLEDSDLVTEEQAIRCQIFHKELFEYTKNANIDWNGED